MDRQIHWLTDRSGPPTTPGHSSKWPPWIKGPQRARGPPGPHSSKLPFWTIGPQWTTGIRTTIALEPTLDYRTTMGHRSTPDHTHQSDHTDRPHRTTPRLTDRTGLRTTLEHTPPATSRRMDTVDHQSTLGYIRLRAQEPTLQWTTGRAEPHSSK